MSWWSVEKVVVGSLDICLCTSAFFINVFINVFIFSPFNSISVDLVLVVDIPSWKPCCVSHLLELRAEDSLSGSCAAHNVLDPFVEVVALVLLVCPILESL
eukprot:2256991-Amphidinium_carterae.1